MELIYQRRNIHMSTQFRLDQHVQQLKPNGMHNIIDWMFDVTDQLDIERDLVEYAISYLHRFLCLHVLSEKKLLTLQEFRLAALTCLMLAIKVHGQSKISPYIIQLLSKNHATSNKVQKDKVSNDHNIKSNGFTDSQIARCELLILRTLSFQLNPPTPSTFLREYMDANSDPIVMEYAMYVVQLLMYQYAERWSLCKASILAMAALQFAQCHRHLAADEISNLMFCSDKFSKVVEKYTNEERMGMGHFILSDISKYKVYGN